MTGRASSEAPELPAVYEPAVLDHADNIIEQAVSSARAGAPEGTLLWTRSQASGVGRRGQTWHSPDGGLYGALILKPDFPVDRAGEIVLVGLVSLGTAIADLVVPMTDLRYRWPADLLLGGSRVAGLWLRRDPASDWLILGFSVNVEQRPEQVFDAGSVCEEGGDTTISSEIVLSGFARHFLSWLNRWAEEGPKPVLRHFRSRSDTENGAPVALVLPDGEKLAGPSGGIDDQGALVLGSEGQARRISINRFFGLPGE